MDTMTTAQEREQFFNRIGREGGTAEDARKILRAAKLLQRWAEQKCGDSGPSYSWAREDCDKCGGSHVRVYPHTGPARWNHGEKCEGDRTRFAGKRAEETIKTTAASFGALARFQGDPRGAVASLCWPSYRKAYGDPPLEGSDGWEGVPS
jgi:hypothetical protein